MKIIDRYIVSWFWKGFLFSLFLFVLLYIVGDLIGHLDDIVTNNVPFVIVCKYYFAMLPVAVSTIMPLSVVLSGLFLISSMGYRNELIAIRSSGYGIFRVVLPLLFSSLVICAVLFWIGERFLPQSSAVVDVLKKDFFKRKRINGRKKLVLKYISFANKDGALIFISKFYPDDSAIKGLVVVLQDERQHIIGKIIAQDGYWKSGNIWQLRNLVIYQMKERRRYYQVKDVDLGFSVRDLMEQKKVADTLGIKQLFLRMRKLDIDEARITYLELKSYLLYKILLVIAPVVLLICGIGFVYNDVRKVDVFLSFAVSAGLFLLLHIGNTISLLVSRAALVDPCLVYISFLGILGGVGILGWIFSLRR